MRVRSILALLLAVALPMAAFGQAPDTLWTKTYGGSANETGFSIFELSGGGYGVVGYTTSYGGADHDLYLLKLDANGDTVWTKVYDNSNEIQDPGRGLQTSDGGFILAAREIIGSYGNVLVVKTDENGNEQWRQTYTKDLGVSVFGAIRQTSDGGYIIAASSVNDAWLIKTNSTGTVTWDYTYPSAISTDWISDVQQTSDGGYIFVGAAYAGLTNIYDQRLVKVNSSGTKQWDKTFGGSGEDYGNKVIQTSDGGYIHTGFKDDGSGIFRNVWVIKTNSSGTQQWSQTYGGSQYDYGNDIEATSDGGYLVTCHTNSFGAGSYDAWFIKINSSGTQEWTKTVGGTQSDQAYEAILTDAGGLLAVGITQSYGAGGADVYVIKLADFIPPDSIGSLTSTPGDDQVILNWTASAAADLDQYNIYRSNSSPAVSLLATITNAAGVDTYSDFTATNGNTYFYRITAVDSTGNESGYSNEVSEIPFVFITDIVDPNTEWSKAYGTPAREELTGLSKTSDGGYIAVGYTGSGPAGGTDLWAVRMDSNGDTLWTQTFGGTLNDYAVGVNLTTDNGFIISGTKAQGDVDSTAAWLIKLDANGTEEWNKTYGLGTAQAGGKATQTSDGGYIMAGWYNSNFWLVKTNNLGVQQWAYEYNNGGQEIGRSVIQVADGGFILVGRILLSGSYHIQMIKTNSSGTQQWYKTFGGSSPEYAANVIETSDGGYLINGSTQSFGAGGSDAWLIKTNSAGTEQWNKTFGGTANDGFGTTRETPDGGYLLAGYTASSGAGSSDAWLIKTNSSGTQEWSTTFGGTSGDGGNSLELTSDEGAIMGGSTISFGSGQDDFYILKIADFIAPDSIGTLAATPGDDQVILNWTANTATDLDEYRIYRDGSSPAVTLLATITNAAGVDTYSDFTATNGNTYYYRITAVDSTGNESGYSNEVSEIPFVYVTDIVDANAKWSRAYGTPADEVGNGGIEQTPDGGYIIAGYVLSGPAGGKDAYVLRLDSNGDTLWTRTFGGSNDDYAYSIEQTPDGGYIIGGAKSLDVQASSSMWLIKLDANGTEQWSQTYGVGTFYDTRRAIQTSDGGYIASGMNPVGKPWLGKTNNLGVLQWENTYDNGGYQIHSRVRQTADGGYITVGNTSYTGSYDVQLIKTNAAGTQQWFKRYGGASDEGAADVRQTTDGGYIILANTQSYGAGGVDIWLIKTDASGNSQWNRTFGGASLDRGNSVKQTPDGGYLISGFTASYGAGGNDAWVIKTDASGIEEWSQTYGGTGNDVGYGIDLTSDEGFVVGGYTDTFGAGGNDIYLIKGADFIAPDSIGTLTSSPADDQVILNWTASPAADLDQYKIYRDGSSPAVTLLATITNATAADTTYTDNTVTSGNTYFYRITAVDSTGNESSNSNEVSETSLTQLTFPGKALQFDGVDDYVDLVGTGNLHMTAPFTMSAWVKYDNASITITERIILGKHQSGSQAGFLLGIGLGGYPEIYLLQGTNPRIVSDVAKGDNQWHHVAASWDGTTANLYVDGTLEKTGASAAPSTNSNTIKIGRYDGNNNTSFPGTIDEVRIWNVARTQTEILDAMHSELSGSETGLVGYWRLDEASGLTTADYSPNANHGTLNGGVTRVSSTVPITPVFPFTEMSTGLDNSEQGDLAWGDYDGDGDLDLFITGRLDNIVTISNIYQNIGGTFTDINAGLDSMTNSAMDWGDYDNDGDLDIILAGNLGSSFVTLVYRNDAGIFTDIGAGLLGIRLGSVDWGDYDNDGDLDILLTGVDYSSNLISRIYRNDNGVFTDIVAGLPGISSGAASWGDYDNDGDLDLVLTGSDGSTRHSKVYSNTGGAFTDIGAGLIGVLNSSAAWGDYDADGDLDILLTGWDGSNRISKVYRNTSGVFTDIAAGLIGVEQSATAWADYDNDGDLDIFLSGETGDGYVAIVYLNNSGSFTDLSTGFTGVRYGSAAWGDYDSDGDVDLIYYGGDGTNSITKLYRNNATTVNTAPTAPGGLAAVTTGADIAALSWTAATDDHTPAAALTYNLRIGTTPIGSEIMAPQANTANGTRRVAAMGNVQENLSWFIERLAPGTYYWSVQAVDAAYAGGAWATEQSFTIALPQVAFPGQALQFDGVDDYVELVGTENFNMTTAFTMSAWVKYDNAAISAVSAGVILGKVQTGIESGFYLGIAPGGFPEIYLKEGSNPKITSAVAKGDNQWHHIAASWDGTTVNLYVDGLLANTGTIPPHLTNSNTIKIGRVDGNNNSSFPGTIDEVRIWNVARSRAEIQTYMHSQLTGGETGLVGYWRMDESSGSTVADYTANGNHGRLFGGVARVTSTVPSAPLTAFTEMAVGLTGIRSRAADWGDYDNDGDLDIVINGYSDSGPKTIIYRNDGGAFTDIGAGLINLGTGLSRWGDYDNDGDLDIAIIGYDGTNRQSKIYRNDAGTFVDINAGLFGLQQGAVAWGDYDNDGDLDLLVAGEAGASQYSIIYRNDGGNFVNINAGLPGTTAGTADWGDYDNDGDLDLLLTGSSGGAPLTKLYRNDTGSFTEVATSLANVEGSSAIWGDYDNDGDLDIILNGTTDGQVSGTISKIYRNDAGSFTDINAGLMGLYYGTPDWGDYDDDGDLDIILPGMDASSGLQARIYKNEGVAFSDISAGLTGIRNGGGSWGDYDGDGDLDLLVAGWDLSNNYTKLYRNNSTFTNVAPTAPTGLTAAVGADSVVLNWSAATDTKTPALGLTYNLRIGTTPGGHELVSAQADSSSGYRRIAAMGNVNHNTSWVIKSLSEAIYYWSVQAVDGAYAGGAWAAEQSFYYDVTAPAAPTNLAATAGDRQLSLVWDANTDPDLSHYWLYRHSSNDSLAATRRDSVFSPDTTYIDTGLTNGATYYYWLTALDNVGNESAMSVGASATPINYPPVITSTNNATATEDVYFKYVATATDPEDSTITWTFDQLPSWLSSNADSAYGTPIEGAVDTSFRVMASDGDLTDTLLVAVTTIAVNSPPVITSTPTATATEGLYFKYVATATDSEDSTITWTLDQLPSWLSSNADSAYGTPFEGAVDTSFRVTASDGDLTDTLLVVVTTIAVNGPPVITSTSSATATEDVYFKYVATATDPEDSTVTFAFDQLPSWLSWAVDSAYGTPLEGATNTAFRVIASDGTLTDTLVVSITVTPVNEPPQITSAPTATATEGLYFKYVATATDPEDSTISWTFDRLPSWLSSNADSAYGTPVEGAVDTSFRVIASDGDLTDTLLVVLTTIVVNGPPVITSTSSATATEDIYFKYVATATDPEDSTVTIAFDQLPSWLSANADSAYGTPIEGTVDTSFRVIASDGSLTDTLLVTVTVGAVNGPPVITSASSASATEDVYFKYVATATDPEDSTVTIAFDQLPSWLSAQGDSVYGIPAEGTVDTSFRVIASDGVLTDTAIVAVTVTPVNDPPQITSLAIVNATEDTYFNYLATATDPEDSTVTFAFDQLPSWLESNADSAFGVPGEDAVDASFRLIASDGELSDTIIVTVDVEFFSPAMIVHVPNLDFGSLPRDSTGSIEFWISNEGQDTLLISNITITDPAFSALQAPTMLPLFGDSGTVEITFTPSANIAYLDTLIIHTNDPDSAAYELALSGSGLKPTLSVSVDTLDFGQAFAHYDTTKSMWLYNTGNALLEISQLTVSGPGFAQVLPQQPPSEETPLLISPSDSAEIGISITPPDSGNFQGLLSITSNDPDRLQDERALIAYGVQPIPAYSSTQYALITGQGGDPEVELVITNEGNYPLQYEIEVDALWVSYTWLSISSSQGVILPHAQDTIMVGVQESNSLYIDTYAGDVIVNTSADQQPDKFITMDSIAIELTVLSSEDVETGEADIAAGSSEPVQLDTTSGIPPGVLISILAPGGGSVNVTSANIAPPFDSLLTTIIDPNGEIDSFAVANLYWEIVASISGVYLADVTFDYSQLLGILFPEGLRLGRRAVYSGADVPWELINLASLVIDTLAQTITATSQTQFSQWTIIADPSENPLSDVMAPTITAITIPATIPGGQAVSVSATVQDETEVGSVTLYYRKGGGIDFSSVAMSSSDSESYGADIPTSAVTHTGLNYFIRAEDNLGYVRFSDTLSIQVSFPANTLTTAMTGSAFTGGFPKNTWRLISVPAVLDQTSVEITIRDDLGEASSNTTWNLYKYAGTGLANYEETSEFVLGESYWLKQVVGENIEFDLGSGKSADLDGYTLILEPRQWHFISSPFTFPVEIQVDQNSLYGPFTYGAFGSAAQEGWSLAQQQTTLQPWGGYVIYNNTDDTQELKIAPVGLNKALAKSETEIDGWRVRLGVEGSRYLDAGNYIGRMAGASEGRDSFDHPELPFMDGYISLFMERPEWGGHNTRFSSDIRSSDVLNGSWPLAISSQGDPGTMTIFPVMEGSLPAEVRVVLLDHIGRKPIDITIPNEPIIIHRRTEEFPHQMTAIVGTPAYVKQTTHEILAALPAEFALAQNYPNPFNPNTTIEYSLPRPARVSLRVYDLLGREMVTLFQGWQDMGYHHVVWNGRDRRGVTLASGIYFAVFQAEKAIRTRKMLLLK